MTELFQLKSRDQRWNTVPPKNVTSAPSLTVFRKRLKTHCFNCSFPKSPVVPAQWVCHIGHYTQSSLLTYVLTLLDLVLSVKLWPYPLWCYSQQSRTLIESMFRRRRKHGTNLCRFVDDRTRLQTVVHLNISTTFDNTSITVQQN